MSVVERKKTRPVRVGGIIIGGGAPISIQSMTSVPLEDVEATVRQIRELQAHGAEIVRLAVRSIDAVKHLKEVRKAVDVMLTADIHFNHRIAIEAIRAGVNKVRINPGNIGDESRVREVVAAARDYGVPIRIGVNGGSLDRKRYPQVTPENLAASAMDHVRILEDNAFQDIIVSIKSSDVFQTIEANRIFSGLRDYPLHIGLTEAGYGMNCIVQSSVVLGHLLLEGIGDTMRVSMTGDPVEEVLVARSILEAVGERRALVRMISCPTCGRTDPDIDILILAREADRLCNERFAKRLAAGGRSITVAVMGCEVNGPGEAADADFGLAGARGGSMILFARGEKIRKIPMGEAVEALLSEIEKTL
jgi:(E)-4-hydroxy-3-methylbut-2-enyl-diphosphate synthase